MNQGLPSEDLFHSHLLAAVREAVIATDLEGCVIYWNKGAEKLYQWTSSEATGRNIMDMTPSEMTRDQAREIIESLSRGEEWSGEFRVRRKDGTDFLAQVSNAPLLNAQGEQFGIVGSSSDLTERKGMESSLRHSQRLESIGRLAGGIAHDFNTLLTSILGYADLLREERSLNAVEEIALAAKRAAELTKQLLAFSSSQVLQPRVLSLQDLMTDLKGVLRRLLRENIELMISVEKDLGRVRVDPEQISQVVKNLLVNARDAMPDGGTLRLALTNQKSDGTDGLPNGSYVVLSVADSGQGIDEEILPFIFEPFFSAQGKGETDLGLATVFGIVTQSSGYVKAHSRVGEGTTFEVYLPRVWAPLDLRDAPKPEVISPSTTGKVVLVCEDDASLRRLICRTLARNGFHIHEASCGDTGVALADSLETLDLLVSDIVMPGLRGGEVAKRVCERHPEVKVLLMSGYPGPESEPLDPSFPFLGKPFSMSDFVRKIRELLDSGKKLSEQPDAEVQEWDSLISAAESEPNRVHHMAHLRTLTRHDGGA